MGDSFASTSSASTSSASKGSGHNSKARMAAKPLNAITARVTGNPEVISVPVVKSSLPNDTRHGDAQLWMLKQAADSSTTRCSMRMCQKLTQMPMAVSSARF